MKKIIFLSSLIFFGCEKQKDKDENFIKAYAEVMVTRAKEILAKEKNEVFNKQDTLKKIFEKYSLTAETYKERLDRYVADIKNWASIQDSATAFLKRKLK